MEQDRFRRLEEVFQGAVGREGPARERYLDDACAGDAALRGEVEELLRRDAQGTRRIRQAAVAGAGEALADGSIGLPERVGPYRILGVLGRGGMGIVYRAVQEDLERSVALKVLPPALLTEHFLARFEQEKRVLARLQHPAIAQLFAAGTTDTGLGLQPWIAMELIEGVRLSDWVPGRGTREKLELVLGVCDAVQHAHQKGVIHRDIKPDNVMVLPDGRPKVLDFGVARVTDADLQLTTVSTDVKSLVGTLPYMSPEQVSGSSERLDTRSDVYGLGVLTYELLAGALPYDLAHRSVAAAAQVIAQEDPRPLSSVDRGFRGDLETIVAKALAKEPDGRYSSAAELGADVRRFLNDEPIQARPHSTAYHLKKLARRHRGLVGGLVATFVVLFGAVIGLATLNAETARAKELAESRVAMSDGVNEYLLRILGSASPFATGGVRGAGGPRRRRARDGVGRARRRLSRPPRGGGRRPGHAGAALRRPRPVRRGRERAGARDRPLRGDRARPRRAASCQARARRRDPANRGLERRGGARARAAGRGPARARGPARVELPGQPRPGRVPPPIRETRIRPRRSGRTPSSRRPKRWGRRARSTSASWAAWPRTRRTKAIRRRPSSCCTSSSGSTNAAGETTIRGRPPST